MADHGADIDVSTAQRSGARDRAVVPVVATLLLCALVVVSAATIGVVFVGPGVGGAGGAGGSDRPADPADSTAVDLSVEGRTFTFTHTHGDPLDVEDLSLRIRVDGEPLAKQPPIPFFSASGFDPGPSGPFNTGSSGEWRAGESASFTLTKTTNSPPIEPGSTVEARFYTDDDVPIITVETVATAS
ncbi:MAG: archaellin/type IV pilin N-terminal domain-containing protein [Haloferacaceae archaeon]